jgi:PKD repeat protein
VSFRYYFDDTRERIILRCTSSVIKVCVISLFILLLLPTANAGNVVTNTGNNGMVTSGEDANVSIMSKGPVAAFSGMPTSGPKPLTVTFTDSSKGSITSEVWEYKLHSGSTWMTLPLDGSASFSFTNAGIYDIQLTVTGKSGSNTKTEPGYISVNETAPLAAFSGSPPSGSKPLSVTFTDSSTGVIASYSWNFGDGGTSNIQNPSHTYTAVGTYTVNLTVTGPGGPDVENKPNYISVTNATTRIGIYKEGVWNLDRYGNGGIGAGTLTYSAWDNAVGDLPIAGDWNGEGIPETGVYRPGVGFYLKMDNSGTWNPSTDVYLAWDNAAIDLPIAGDWNMDGRTETGVYRPGAGFYLKMDNGSTWNPSTNVNPAYTFRGVSGWISVVGDWNGDGKTKIGVYKEGMWYLDWNGNGAWEEGTDKFYNNPARSDFIPVIGDWNGDGKSKIGVYRWGYWSLDFLGAGTYTNFPIFIGPEEYTFSPVVGDWNGDGKSKMGAYRATDGTWQLDYYGNRSMVRDYSFGTSGFTPVTGDWNGDGKSKIGVFKDGTWRLDYYGNGSLIKVYSFGTTGSSPVIGDWNGDGKSKIGVYKDGAWQLDYNGNGVWDGASTDKEYPFGATGWIPVVGKWS